jgi:hypothetical protein
MVTAFRSSHHLWPSAEQQLLLTAALLDDARAQAAFNAWSAQVSMEDEFSQGAYRLLPYVYHRMQALGIDAPVMGRLKGVYRRAWVDTHRLFHAVRPAVQALVDAGVQVMLAKGAPLALTYYHQLALRPMSDVDVLVPRAQLEATLDILRELGWRMGFAYSADTIRFRHAIPCFGPEGMGGELDLHWRPLYESPPADSDASFRSTAEPFDFLGVPVVQPDPTHHLFSVVAHGVRWNSESPVRWIPDALAILRARGGAVDWERLPALATNHRVNVRLALGLEFLAEHFDAPVPRFVITRLRAAPVSAMERLENSVLLAGDDFYEPSPLRNQWMYLAEYSRRTDARTPLEFALGYTHFLRYRLGLGGRRELIPMLMRSLRRRLAGGHHIAMNTSESAGNGSAEEPRATT